MSRTDLCSKKSGSARREILVVDDDKIIHMLHKKSIELCGTGLPVTGFENGQLALKHIEQHPYILFLVFLDLNMPVMDGWEFLEECRARKLQNLFTVIVTSSTNSADKIKMFDFPQVIAYCEKPFTTNKIREVLEMDELKPFSDLADECI